MPDILAVLRRLGVQATFFVTGRWADEHPGRARMIGDGGHAVGNGSWSRKDLSQLADWEVERELLLADDRLRMSFGPLYAPLFRGPCAAVDGRVRAIVERLGFTVVQCTINGFDADDGPVVASNIERRILQHSDDELDGATILLHCDAPETAEALHTAVRSLWRRGFEFVTLPDWISSHEDRRRTPVLSAAGSEAVHADPHPR